MCYDVAEAIISLTLNLRIEVNMIINTKLLIRAALQSAVAVLNYVPLSLSPRAYRIWFRISNMQ